MLLGLPAMTVNIEWQDQQGRWHHLQSKQNQTDAYRVAMRRAEATGKRHRFADATGRLLELLPPSENRPTALRSAPLR